MKGNYIRVVNIIGQSPQKVNMPALRVYFGRCKGNDDINHYMVLPVISNECWKLTYVCYIHYVFCRINVLPRITLGEG
jgi:hypothetical protein